MDPKEIEEIEQNSNLVIFSALKAYVDFLDDALKVEDVDKVKKFITRPEKETYQICICILIGIVIGRLAKVDGTQRTQSCVNAVTWFNLGLSKTKSFKDRIFPNLDLETDADGKFSKDGNNALKWGLSNITKGDGAKLITTGQHIATAIIRNIKEIPDTDLDRDLINKRGSYLAIGENFLMGVMLAVINKDLKVKL
tara:strand:+ start:294 stop:881 length:588 start_codon:yes stop_codon:yes gene_type:complete